MKGILVLIVVILLVSSLNFAIATNAPVRNAQNSSPTRGANDESDSNYTAQNNSGGALQGENRERQEIHEIQKTETKLNVSGKEIASEMKLIREETQNETNIHAQLSNGRNALIKVMPETASARAIERLQLKVCSSENNCTIQLKEVGQGNETRALYEVRAEKETRVLGLFKKNMTVTAEVDSESGDVVKVNKKWWAFLAAE